MQADSIAKDASTLPRSVAPVDFCTSLGTNLIHDFTAVTFFVKLTSFREKR